MGNCPPWWAIRLEIAGKLYPILRAIRPKSKFYMKFFCKFDRDIFSKIESDFNLKGFLFKMEPDVELWSDSFLQGFLS